jgi:myo-inositol-1(or 4)-monophosphatase
LKPWDMAAGSLLVREAGGLCTDMLGAPLDLRGAHILADNTALHGEVVELFTEIFAGKQRVPLPG